jgi:F-type H+-transporting ATPase subunit delta
MAGTRAAIRYAKAILSLATDNGKAKHVQSDMDHILQTIQSNASLSEVLKSPVVKLSEKAAVLNTLFSSVGEEAQSLFKILVSNKRVDLLSNVAAQYSILFDQLNNKEQATVTTAVPMTADLEIKVMTKLKTLSSKEVSLEKIVDESILGGFILRVGDQQYDASVSNQLNELKNKFTIN